MYVAEGILNAKPAKLGSVDPGSIDAAYGTASMECEEGGSKYVSNYREKMACIYGARIVRNKLVSRF
jgi:hypothetical protein